MSVNKINLTDQELNEWVCFNVMRWNPVHKCGDIIYNATLLPRLEIFDPCQDLNHTRLMEEKIREMIDYEDFAIRDVYYKNLCEVVFDPDVSTGVFRGFNIIHASARQRCEAAWVTFNK